MLAILTTTLVCVVDSEEEAGSLAIEADKVGRLQLEHVLEVNGASRADLDGLMHYVGTSVSILPDAALAPDG